MIIVSAFFSGTLATVDAVIVDFVNKAYTNLVQEYSTSITLVFTVFIMLIGYQFLFRRDRMDVIALIRHLIVMLCVFGLVMNWNLYNIFVYNIFTNEPAHISQILTSATGKIQSQTSMAYALDQIYEAVVDTSVSFFGQINFSVTGFAFIIYGGFVFLIGSLMCVFCLLLFIYAKMMMAIALALGPIFILFLLWESTQNLFAAWLKKLITLALIPIVTSIILVLMISVISVTLPDINQPTDNLRFYGIAPFLGLNLATILILSQVFRICSALGGGISLSSISRAHDMARPLFDAAKKIYDAVKNTINKLLK